MKRLTDAQKSAILNYRSAGLGYKAIADKLSLSRETVRSFCVRHSDDLEAIDSVNADFLESAQEPCKNCGKPVGQREKTKHRLFCSDGCRQSWWNAHPDAVKKRAVYEYTCPYCGGVFAAYGNSHRKYCSHACYIADRFGKAVMA